MILAIIQARMSSTRLPGKVLKDLQGHPVLWHVVDRVRQARSLDRVVVATSDESSDDPIEQLCALEGIDVFRGSEEDVLDRFFHAAQGWNADGIVRITADCPLIDPIVIDRVVGEFLKGGYDYVSNTLHGSFPDGLDVEVFTRESLEKAWSQSSKAAEREHVTVSIRNSGLFRTKSVTHDPDLSQAGHRWTLDEQADLDFVRAVYGHLYTGGKLFVMEDVLKLLEEHPEIQRINQGFIRNEGYYLSIAREAESISPTFRRLEESAAWLERARRVIPSQTQTFSKGPNQFVQGVSPVFLRRGEGARVWDVDGNEYIDFVLALGPIILGYNWPSVMEAVMRQLRDGPTFTLPHPLEVELAELLVEIIPCAEMVRFGKSGSDVTSGAVRVARAYTGRDKIACCGYHGWQDWYIGTTTRNLGIPGSVSRLTVTFQYNDLESLEQVFKANPDEIAAVIMEPVRVEEPAEGFLAGVHDLTRKYGALLIFDEVVTGFRLGLGGAGDRFGVKPDLACFGKAMANGFPVSAVVGRRDVMELFDEVFFSFTFGGEAVSLAAAVATIKELRQGAVFAHLWEEGTKLKDGYNVIAREFGLAQHTRCMGPAPHTVMTFSASDGGDGLILRSLLQQELAKRGVLFLVGNNICASHTDADVDHALRGYRAALERIAAALDSGNPRAFLEGEPVQPVFRKP